MSNINKKALRERYSEKPSPKCHICGAVMTIQRAGPGGVVYGCMGRIDRDGEGYKFEAGRDFADDHYDRSRVTDYSPSGDPDVLALLDELEAAEKRIDILRQDKDKVIDMSTERVSKLLARAEDAENRVAELKARELVVNLPAYVDGRTLGYGEVNHMIDLCADAIEKAGHAAGIITKVGE